MTAGRLIAVVGPSGVGKDSLISALAAVRPDLNAVRRVITRAPDLGGEAYEPVSEEDFGARKAKGDFCLSWTAHGLSYGIPRGAVDIATSGRDVVANLSRGALEDAARVFPNLIVLNVTASPETLARRLAARGRESVEDARARLARRGRSLPEGLDVVDISNDGRLEATVAQALAALDRVRA